MLASIPLKATTQYQKGQKIFIKYSLYSVLHRHYTAARYLYT